MSDEITSCVEPAGDVEVPAQEAAQTSGERETSMQAARVGGKAPDFQGNAYVDGGFKQVKLSDHDGEWRMLCFYPGDFTFV